MKNLQIEKTLNTLLSGASIIIIIGAILKIIHNQNGDLILWIGFITHFILSSYEIKRLKGINKFTKEDTLKVE